MKMSAESYEKVVVDLNHGGVHASSQALNLRNREQAILSGLPNINLELVLNGVHDSRGVTQHAGRGGAHLEEVLAHLLPVEHRVEGGDLVHPHRVHLQHLSHMVHGGDGQPAFLALGQVKGRHHGCLLVLCGVLLNDRSKARLVLRIEFPLGGRVVVS